MNEKSLIDEYDKFISSFQELSFLVESLAMKANKLKTIELRESLFNENDEDTKKKLEKSIEQLTVRITECSEEVILQIEVLKRYMMILAEHTNYKFNQILLKNLNARTVKSMKFYVRILDDHSEIQKEFITPIDLELDDLTNKVYELDSIIVKINNRIGKTKLLRIRQAINFVREENQRLVENILQKWEGEHYGRE